MLLAGALLTGCRDTAENDPVTVDGPELTVVVGEQNLAMAGHERIRDTWIGRGIDGAVDELKQSGIRFSLYDNGRLGNEYDLLAGLKSGSVGMAWMSSRTQAELIPETAILNIPGLFTSRRNMNAWLGASFNSVLREAYAREGIRYLGCYCGDWRILVTREEVSSARDLRGWTIGITDNPYEEEYWKQFGMQTMTVESSELVSVFSKGRVDAISCTIESYNDIEKGGRTAYITPLQLSVESSVLLMNEDVFYSFTADEQAAILRFAEELRQYSSESDPYTALNQGVHVKVTEPSYEFVEEMKRGHSVCLGSLRDELGQDNVERFLREINRIGD